MARRRLIILGAGSPNLGSQPTTMRKDWGGKTTVEWLSASTGCLSSEILLLAGYEATKVRNSFPNLSVIGVDDWQVSGSLSTLLQVELDESVPTIVAYSDILIRATGVQRLLAREGDICVGVDRQWRGRFPGRRIKDLRQCEKLLLNLNTVEDAGRDISIERASAEFVGMMLLSPLAAAWINQNRHRLQTILGQGASLSDLLQARLGIPLTAVFEDLAGEWAEIRHPNDVAHFLLGTKAQTLLNLKDVLKHAVVPELIVMKVDDWRSDADLAIDQVRGAFGSRPLIVRSSSTFEDSFSNSGAGAFSSVKSDGKITGTLSAVENVIESYSKADIDSNNQEILIQEYLVDVDLAGVAMTRTTEHHVPSCKIEFTLGPETDLVTSGRSDQSRTLVINGNALLDPETFASESTINLIERLQPALTCINEVTRLLNFDALDIEFALKGDTAYLLQARPVTSTEGPLLTDEQFHDHIVEIRERWVEVTRTPHPLFCDVPPLLGVMPDWNPAEIIGLTPNTLACELYCTLITDQVWAQQRHEAGYQDLSGVKLMHDLAGHVYIDVRASLASFIPKTLDLDIARRLLKVAVSRLKDNPELHDKVEFTILPTCLDFTWVDWNSYYLNNGFTDQEIVQLRSGLLEITNSILNGVSTELDLLASFVHESELVHRSDLGPIPRAAKLLDLCVNGGTLRFAHLARAAFVSEAILRSATDKGIISDDAADGFRMSLNTVSKELQDERTRVLNGDLALSTFYSKWSHLRPGTYDICSPRYGDDPDRFFRIENVGAQEWPLPRPAEFVGENWVTEFRTLQAHLEAVQVCVSDGDFAGVFRQAIEGRERAKFEFTRNLSMALECFLQHWEPLGLERHEMAYLPIDVLLSDHDYTEMEIADLKIAAAHARSRQRLASATILPPLLSDVNEVNIFEIGNEVPNFVGRLTAIGKTAFLRPDATHVNLDNCVVLIESADPGFDWIFNFDILALVTAYGGANSHMSIRAAELNLTAAIGVGAQAFRKLIALEQIEINPTSRVIRAVS